jgi:competence protein ComFC
LLSLQNAKDVSTEDTYADIMFDLLLDLLFPRQSLSGTEGSFVTETERMQLCLTPLLLVKKTLQKRGLRFLDTIVAAGHYDESDGLKKMILTYKYKSVPAFADDLAKRMTDAARSLLPTTLNIHSKPVLCPVPLHWIRRNERGFNQALQLAERIAKAQNWQVEELLLRTRATGHQAHRNRPERLVALIGAFAVKPKAQVPEWVILVDDLSTTGATLEECAKMLKNAGVLHVSGLVAAAG